MYAQLLAIRRHPRRLLGAAVSVSVAMGVFSPAAFAGPFLIVETGGAPALSWLLGLII